MNRKIVFAAALFALGLMAGIVISSWFLPSGYGFLTMVLLVLGGIVTGAVLPRAARRVGGSRIVKRLPPLNVYKLKSPIYLALPPRFEWWQRLPSGARRRAGGMAAAVLSPSFAIGYLFGAVGLALYGQFVFASQRDLTWGYYAYFSAICCFVLLVRALDKSNTVLTTYIGRTSGALALPLRRRWRLGVIFIAALGALWVTFVGATTAWNQPQRENIVLWLGICFLYASAFVPWRRLARWLGTFQASGFGATGQKLWQHRSELLLLAIILAIGFVVRYWHLASVPGIFGGDEGEMGAEALAILNGELQNPFITGWLSHPTLYFFVQSFSLEIFGQTVYGLRVPSVIAGTLSVFVTYLLIRRLFNPRLALITSALLAVYNFHIHFSRLALNNIFDSVFAPLVLLLLYVGLESRRPPYFAAAGMAMGLSIYFYHGARLIPVLVGLFGIYLLLTERKLIFENALNFVWLGLGSLVVAGPLLYSFYLRPNEFMARLTGRGIFQSGWFNAQLATGRVASEILFEQVRRSFLAFNVVPDPTTWFGTGEPLFDPLSGMFLVFGMVYGILQLRSKNYALFLLWLVSGIFFGSTLMENPPTSTSFVMMVVPALFFVALGVDKLIEFASQVLRPLARVRRQVLAAFVILFAAWSLAFYFIDYTPRYIYGGDPNWVAGEMVKYLQQRHDKYHVYFVAPPYIYLGIGSLKFMMPHLDGEDVLKPISGPEDLEFVHKSNPALFLFVPARADEFPIVQKQFPNGVVHAFTKPDGNSLFFIYEVNTP